MHSFALLVTYRPEQSVFDQSEDQMTSSKIGTPVDSRKRYQAPAEVTYSCQFVDLTLEPEFLCCPAVEA